LNGILIEFLKWKEIKVNSNLSCPVSVEKADENVTRVIAVFNVIILAAGIYLESYILVLLLALDFGLRAFTTGKYSLIKTVSKKVVYNLELKPKLIDASPKKFAAGLGLVFSIIISASLIFGNFILAYLFSGILAICALLEGIFSICIGCYIYSFIVVPFYKQQRLKTE